jgi:hypothetical protein
VYGLRDHASRKSTIKGFPVSRFTMAALTDELNGEQLA